MKSVSRRLLIDNTKAANPLLYHWFGTVELIEIESTATEVAGHWQMKTLICTFHESNTLLNYQLLENNPSSSCTYQNLRTMMHASKSLVFLLHRMESLQE